MKRAERNEYNYIRRYEKQFELSYGTTLTIRTPPASGSTAGCTMTGNASFTSTA